MHEVYSTTQVIMIVLCVLNIINAVLKPSRLSGALGWMALLASLMLK